MHEVINPITEFREEHKLDQKDLAEYAGITSQVILRAEQGLYNSLPPSVAYAIGMLDRDAAFTIGEDYRKWQILKLEANRARIGELMPNKYIMPGKLRLEGDTDSIASFVDFRYRFSESVMGFCKLFLIQQSIVSKYETGKMDNIPEIILERLDYLGYGFIGTLLKGLPAR